MNIIKDVYREIITRNKSTKELSTPRVASTGVRHGDPFHALHPGHKFHSQEVPEGVFCKRSWHHGIISPHIGLCRRYSPY